MLDGKGLVYQKRAGTGSAVYTGPAAQIGANPLDVIANQIRVEGKYKVAEAAQKKAANLKALNVDLEGWDYDNKRYFAQMEDQLKREGAALATAGKDLNNFADVQVADWSKKVDKWKKAALASTNQGEMYKALVDTASKDPQKYDLEATMLGGKKYMDMTPDERLTVDPQTLLVRRYDPLKPVENLDINKFTGLYQYSTPTSEISINPLKAKNLKREIDVLAENPQNAEYYEYNKEKFGWKSLDDYKNYLFDYAKNQYMKKYSGGVKEKSAASAGTGYLDVTPATVLGESTPYARKNSTRGLDTIQLGNVNAIISGNDAYRTKDYTRLGNDTREVKSGAMVNVVVNDVGEVLSIPYYPSDPNKIVKYSIYDKTTGKDVELSGTHDQISAQLVKGTYGKYQPMIYGLTDVYKGDGETQQDEAIWVNPTAIINGVNGAKFAPAYYELVRRANERNSKIQGDTTLNTTQNTQGAQTYDPLNLFPVFDPSNSQQGVEKQNYYRGTYDYGK